MKEITGSDSEIIFVQPQDERTKDDPQVRCPDITRARELLDWSAQVTLEEGLQRTAAYFSRQADLT